ncbi:hypothetical protein [Bradyrhizobium acaciae]|uniref:hypothetical protein n=1 Tax=Bradyrhizobium acaciae TaxID=2683706 RepID=UPI001E2A6302|nr:hypothetical protein [Bradyrhizobium acaciae]MCC8981035.1 hypothetical protein [Bradyrhizobium acaciae]
MYTVFKNGKIKLQACDQAMAQGQEASLVAIYAWKAQNSGGQVRVMPAGWRAGNRNSGC